MLLEVSLSCVESLWTERLDGAHAEQPRVFLGPTGKDYRHPLDFWNAPSYPAVFLVSP